MSKIWTQCVNSVDLCKEIGCDYIYVDRQIGVGIMLVKNEEWIGYIDDYIAILGNDYIISKIVIHNDEKLSNKLSNKFLGKIIIPCDAIDRCIS